jgi:hypothetical protein
MSQQYSKDGGRAIHHFGLHKESVVLFLPTNVYKPACFNGNSHSASSQILRAQLNYPNCQPLTSSSLSPMYMRSITGYIAIVALAATQGTGIPCGVKSIF